ncbi:MAG: hypothetical protein HY782_26885 [Chloroflexi bacterium]|nr:hypothetical protein [Chloroflexota bacterium]
MRRNARITLVGSTEDPQAAVAIAAQYIGLSIPDERLDTPKVIAFWIEIATSLDQLALGAGASDTKRA